MQIYLLFSEVPPNFCLWNKLKIVQTERNIKFQRAKVEKMLVFSLLSADAVWASVATTEALAPPRSAACSPLGNSTKLNLFEYFRGAWTTSILLPMPKAHKSVGFGREHLYYILLQFIHANPQIWQKTCDISHTTIMQIKSLWLSSQYKEKNSRHRGGVFLSPRWRDSVTAVKDWRHRGGVSKNTIRQHTATSATALRRDFINWKRWCSQLSSSLQRCAIANRFMNFRHIENGAECDFNRNSATQFSSTSSFSLSLESHLRITFLPSLI